MEFKVTILGSNSALPAHGRHQTSQVVTIGDSLLLVDCGESTQIQLRKFKIRISKINHIFISHLHGDHYLGLMGLISTFHLSRRERPLVIFGPKGLDEIIRIQLKYGHTRLHYPIQFVPTKPDIKNLLLEEKYFKVYSFPLKHRIPCTGFSFEEKHRPRNLIKEKILASRPEIEAIHALREGRDFLDENGAVKYAVADYTHPPAPLRKYGFCSDTIYDEAIIPYIKDVNLLYHEATFMNIDHSRAKDTFHSTGAQAAKIAQAAKAQKLLLGHFSTRYVNLNPLLCEAQEVFQRTLISEEGQTYLVD